MPDDRIEARALAAAAAELLRWEGEVGGFLAAPAVVAVRDRLHPHERNPASTHDDPGARLQPDVSVVASVTAEYTASVPAGSASHSPSSPEGAAAADGPRAAPDAKRQLDALAAEVSQCARCGLATGRTQTVFARGSVDAEIVFVGEGPGYNEDLEGEPFVGAAGQLLDKMIAAMGYARDAVYICNVVKCRPPDNRTPTAEESAACMPFLTQQLAIVQPRAIVALGRCAAEALGCMPETGRGWRGQWGRWMGIDVMPTYHPAYLLRTPRSKKETWDDLQAVMRRLGRPLPR